MTIVDDKKRGPEADAEEQKEEEFSKKQVLGRLISIAKCEFYMASLFSFLNGVTIIGFAIGFKYTLEWLIDLQNGIGKMPDVAIHIAILFGGIGVLCGVMMFLQMSLFSRFGTKASCTMRERYYKALLVQDISFHDVKKSSQLNASLASDGALINVGVGTQFGLTIQHLGEFAGGFAYSFYESPEVTAFMLALMPALMVIGWIQGQIASATTSTEEDEFAESTGESGETLAGLRTVKSLNAEHQKGITFNKMVESIGDMRRHGAWRTGLGMGFFLFGTFALIYGPAFTFGAFRIDKGKLTSDELLGAFFGVLLGGMGLGQIGASYPDIEKGLIAAFRMFKIIDREPNMKKPRETAKKSGIEGHIEFRNVSFAYPTRKEMKVYDGLDCTIQTGQTVAFCGPTGCGKSTIVNLIERFYDPDSGDILIDGEPIHNYDLAYLRSQISLVSQEPVLFDASIKENIALGVTRKVSDQEIEDAARRANAHDFISSFPDGYNTRTGEKGSQMSGGQKQRIAIARAILKKSKIILLDEATSALDTKSEKIVQDALDALIAAQSATCIIIAHRLSTIQNADVIIVLESGKIVEKGTHQELLKLDRVYSHMVNAQALAMADEGGEALSPRALARQVSYSGSIIKES